MNVNIKISKQVFNDVYLPYLENEDRYLIFYGGGSSGKSYFIAQRFIYKLLKPKRCNLLVVRQTGDTNRKSTFPLLKQVISNWNLSKHFKINESDMRIKCLLSGNEVAFAGLDDVEKIKSITFENGELTDIWVEEATETQEADINQLKVRLRGGKSKKQIVLSFNPINIQHWIKGHFIDSKLATVCFSTYKDNKFLTDDDRKALEDLKYTDEYTYNVYCLGQWGILGKTVFDARAIQNRLSNLSKPLMTGYFTYDYDGLKISNIKWVKDKNGYINIYQLPDTPHITKFAIGCDTSGEGSDFFTAHVLDAKTGNQAAVLKQQFDADLFTKQVYCLGKWYGTLKKCSQDALIGIEANFDSFPIMELQRLGYLNQYVREAQDTYTGRTEKRFGFKTTSLTRPTIISRLIEIVREETNSINDKDTLEELLTIIRNEKGRIEAPEGGHDDQMMGLAIAHHIREQVTFDIEEIRVNPQYHFNLEKSNETHYDYGEDIVIV
ncbi:MAG: PBSX family phage terminase large subunit [Bacilli bacterium]|nr:PBSX family phage terminase large subunit [Bacilli bacterium]